MHNAFSGTGLKRTRLYTPVACIGSAAVGCTCVDIQSTELMLLAMTVAHMLLFGVRVRGEQ